MMDTRQIQLLLNFLDYDTGGVDGLYGPKTTQAVRAFQEEFSGREGDGKAGVETKRLLRKAVGDGWTRPEKKTEAGPELGPTGTLWDEIQYFTREEFRCRCGEKHARYCNGFPVEPNETLVRVADRVRGNLGNKAHRTSGLRCEQHNRNEGGVENSKHLYGKALDFWVENVTGAQLLSEVQKQPEVNYAYIVSGNVVHMDVK